MKGWRTGMVVTPASFVNRMLKSVSVSVLSAGNKGLRTAIHNSLLTSCLLQSQSPALQWVELPHLATAMRLPRCKSAHPVKMHHLACHMSCKPSSSGVA